MLLALSTAPRDCVAQEHPVQERRIPQRTALDAEVQSSRQESVGRDLFLDPGGAFVLTGFRDYELRARERCDSILSHDQLRAEIDLAIENEMDRSVIADARIAMFHMQLSLSEGGEVGLPEMLARFLLRQALQFGYQYARERVRAGSLDEMDYLYLPQGPGVTRTFDEVGGEARSRGEDQSTRIWRDYRESRKNRISLKK